MTPTVENWRAWLDGFAGEPGYPFVMRAIGTLVADEKIAAVWIAGSRATRQADAHSDTDIRVHAPTWSTGDLEKWLQAVDPEQRPQVRLSRFGPSVLNYECLFREGVPVDLLVLTGEAPVLAFDSVVFKWREPLQRQPAPQVIKEVPLAVDDVRNLMDGVVIDQQKFRKLSARGDRLAALFLIEAQRFALLRLAYIAARGVDCGGKLQHTLASLKLVRDIVVKEGRPAIVEVAKTLEWSGAIEDSVAKIAAAIPVLFAELRGRFTDLK